MVTLGSLLIKVPLNADKNLSGGMWDLASPSQGAQKVLGGSMTASKTRITFIRYLRIWGQSQSGDVFKEQVKVQIVLDLTWGCVPRNPSRVENIVRLKMYLTNPTSEQHSSTWPPFHALGTLP